MSNPLIRKVARFMPLSEEDEDLLKGLCGNVRHIPAKRDIIREGDRPHHVHIVLEGWAARYKVLPNGTRQITALLMPGDMCDLHVTMLEQMDHNIAALCPVTMAEISHNAIAQIAQERPDLNKALWASSLVDEAVMRSWIVSIGRRSAKQRMAHLFCELHVRLDDVGLATDDGYGLPLTQDDLADALGLTSVHCNRMLKELNQAGCIERRRGHLTILDWQGLRTIAAFDPNYLNGRQLRSTPRP